MKQKIKSKIILLAKEIAYGGHIPAFVGFSVISTEYIFLRSGYSGSILALSYLIPLIIYSYNYLFEKDIDSISNPERSRHFKSMLRVLPILFSLYLFVFVGLLLSVSRFTALFSVFLVGGGILFSVYFKSVTKKILAFKNIYTAFLWALLVFLPVIAKGSLIDYSIVCFFIFVFFRVLLNTIFFDVKDVKVDSLAKLKTFPVKFGLANTKYFLVALNVVSFVPLLVGVFVFNLSQNLLILLFLLPYSMYYLFRLDKIQGYKLRALSYFMADGEYILWPILVILFSKLLFSI